MFQERLLPVLRRMSDQIEDPGESRSSAALRDALLPRLLSGELPIRHAERFVEAHL